MSQQDEVTGEGKSKESGGLFGGVRKLLGTTKEKVSGTTDMVTGKKLRQQLEDFTDVVSTAVIGVHRDQQAARELLAQVQQAQDEMQETLAQVQESLVRLERRSTSPWWMFWRWRWI